MKKPRVLTITPKVIFPFIRLIELPLLQDGIKVQAHTVYQYCGTKCKRNRKVSARSPSGIKHRVIRTIIDLQEG